MAPRALVPVGISLALLLPLAAGARDALRPLRTLTFDCTVSVADVRETPGDTQASHWIRLARGTTAATSPTGTGVSEDSRQIDVKGSITVAVLSATEDDAGLIVEVTENAAERSRAKVEVAIGPDGGFSYRAADGVNLTEEEIAVVRWLARGFYGDHPREPGTAWTVDQSVNGRVDIEHYKVLSRDRDRVTLDYALVEKEAGVTGYDATREGSLVYDTALIVPVKATFQSSSRRLVGPTMSTVRSRVTLTLTADSFGHLRP